MAAGGLAALVPVDTAQAQASGPGGTPQPGDKVTTVYPGSSSFGFDQWASVQFTVPAGVNRITVSRTFDAYDGLPGIMADVLDIGLYGPSGFRGWSGGARSDFTVSAADATPGYLPGAIDPGTWSVALGPVVFNPAGMHWQVTVTLEYGAPLASVPFAVLPASLPGRGQSWYRGDMHTHTVYSDGGRTLEQLVAEARANGLDFLTSTEHNTSSAGVSWAGKIPTDLLVINGEEVTTRHGHWLALGMPQGEEMDWHFSPKDGVFPDHANHVRNLGGVVVAAHPLTPAPGSFWEFGFNDVDAIEIWNGPWTLDDEAAVAMWAAMLFFGQRIPAVGNSDTHFAPDDVVGLPQTVVNSKSLSRTDLLDGVRHGRTYLAESSAVTLNITASCNGNHAGPGDSLPVSFFDSVNVTVTVSGAPGSILALYTEWGLMMATVVGDDGNGRIAWNGWGWASIFARAEVRRPKPGASSHGVSTLDQMVALSNPVWLGSAPTPKPIYQGGQTFLHTSRRPAGWTPTAPVPGLGGASVFTGAQAGIAGLADGSALLLGLAGDNSLWLNQKPANGTWQTWQQLAGPGGSPTNTPDLASRTDAAKAAALLAVQSTRAPKNLAAVVGSGPTAGTLAAGAAGTAPAVVQSGCAFREAAITAMPDGSSQIIATGLNGALYHQVRSASGQLSGFTPVLGPSMRNGQNLPWVSVKAAIAGMPDGSAQVISFNPDGVMYLATRFANGTWTSWTHVIGVGGAADFRGTALAITGMPDGSSQLVAIGLDNVVYHQIRSASGAYAGFANAGGIGSSVAIAGMPDGTAQIGHIGTDGNVWHSIRYTNGGWQRWMQPAGMNGGLIAGAVVRMAAMPDGSMQLMTITPS
ncbi:CehA/McbA family metallohydrolase [Streptomyces sp. NPDC048362]|uniref:CehA/McbA family metallohydrolase n=1 Tax=Streptomyces sp. NPDC048362 TaxID=3365539 RepID=UPI003721B589